MNWRYVLVAFAMLILAAFLVVAGLWNAVASVAHNAITATTNIATPELAAKSTLPLGFGMMFSAAMALLSELAGIRVAITEVKTAVTASRA